MIPQATWGYSYARSDHGDNFKESWNGGFSLEIVEAFCGESEAKYSVRQTYEVRHSRHIYLAGGSEYLTADTTVGEVTGTIVEYPDGAVGGVGLKFLTFDMEQRYHSEMPSGFFITLIGLPSEQRREQKYRSGVGLVQSSTYPAPYLGFISSTTIRLTQWSIPDSLDGGSG